MSGKSRWDYLKAIYFRYKKVSKPLRARILDEFCQVCGYDRKYAIRLLDGPAAQKPKATTPKGRRPTYGEGDLVSDGHLGSRRLSLFGAAKLYFAKAFQALKPGGLFLNHGIGGGASVKGRLKSRFIDSYVFPDGELRDIGTVLREAELAGFEVIDVEFL